jgi:hypothetical protein
MFKSRFFADTPENTASTPEVVPPDRFFYGLQEHLALCQSHSNVSFNLKCALDQVHTFVYARVVTTVAGVLIVLGVGYLLV